MIFFEEKTRSREGNKKKRKKKKKSVVSDRVTERKRPRRIEVISLPEHNIYG